VTEGPECMPNFTFGMWSMIRDCLGPAPSHKASLVFVVGCGTHPLQSVRQYPLKEKHAVGSRTTEPSARPYKDRFSHKITIQSTNDLGSDLMSEEEGALAHQAQRTMHLRVPP
jgi:hypothetical protein